MKKILILLLSTIGFMMSAQESNVDSVVNSGYYILERVDHYSGFDDTLIISLDTLKDGIWMQYDKNAHTLTINQLAYSYIKCPEKAAQVRDEDYPALNLVFGQGEAIDELGIDVTGQYLLKENYSHWFEKDDWFLVGMEFTQGFLRGMTDRFTLNGNEVLRQWPNMDERFWLPHYSHQTNVIKNPITGKKWTNLDFYHIAGATEHGMRMFEIRYAQRHPKNYKSFWDKFFNDVFINTAFWMGAHFGWNIVKDY